MEKPNNLLVVFENKYMVPKLNLGVKKKSTLTNSKPFMKIVFDFIQCLVTLKKLSQIKIIIGQ